MENVLTRYRNTTVLVAVLFVQIIGLAVQVKKPTDAGSISLIRYWVVSAITPLERGLVGTSQGIRNVWSNYLYLRGVRSENRALREQIDRMRLDEVRLKQDADQARRLQALLAFKEQFIAQTVAAQVIGSSGSEQSRIIYIDKGANDGIQPDMAVISPTGIVGKVLRTFRNSAQVLEISDQTSGVGAILEKSRLQGILKGSEAGDVTMQYVMSDEKVEPGEHVITSGGDRIFPKGLPIGTVTAVSPGRDLFLNIRVKPSADLSRLEEVLIITRTVEKEAEAPDENGPVRAADILARRLPTVEKKPPAEAKPAASGAPGTAPVAPKPGNETVAAKPKPQVAKPAAATLPGAQHESLTPATASETRTPAATAKPAPKPKPEAPKPPSTPPATKPAAVTKLPASTAPSGRDSRQGVSNPPATNEAPQ